MAEVVQELLYQIGADVSDLKKKVGEVSEATSRIKEAGGGIGEKLTEEFTHAVSSIGPLTGALVEFGGVLTGVAAVVAGIELAKSFVEASIEAQAAEARIAAATGATGERLVQLREEFELVNTTVTASSAEVATAVGAVTAKLGLAGEAAESTARKLIQLATVTGTDLGSVLESVPKTLAGFGLSIEQSAGFFDTLVRTTQATGVSLGTLQSVLVSSGPAFRGLGLDAEQAAALVGSLEQSGIDAGAAVGSLRIFLTRASQAGLDAGDAFRQVVARIRDAKTESEALAESQQTFGRQFVQVADFIRRTGFDLDAFVAKVRAVQPGLAESAANSATLGDEFKRLGKSIEQLAENAGAIDFVRDRVRELATAMRSLAEAGSLVGPGTALRAVQTGTAGVVTTQKEVDEAAKKVKESFDRESESYAKNAAAAADSAAKNAALEAAHDGAAAAASKAAEAAAKETAAHATEVAALNSVNAAFEAGLGKRDAFIKNADAVNRAGEQLAQGLRGLAAQAASQGAAFNEPEAKLKLFQTTVQGLTAAGVPLEQALNLVGKAVSGIDTTKSVEQIKNLHDATGQPIRPAVDASPIDGLVAKIAEAKKQGGTIEIKLAADDAGQVVAQVKTAVVDLGKPQELKLSDADARQRVDAIETKLAGIEAQPVELKITDADALARVAEVEKDLASVADSAKPIDLTVDTGDSRAKLAEVQDDARRVGIEVAKTKNSGGEIVIELKSGPVLDAAGQLKAGLDSIPRKVDVELDLKIKSEAAAFDEQVRIATADIDIFGSKFAEIPSTIGKAFPQLAGVLRSTGTEFGRLSATAQAKAAEIKKALADGFSEGDDHVKQLRQELDDLTAPAEIKITADISAIGDAVSTIDAEISQGAPTIKIKADITAAQAAIDSERQRIAALPTVEERIRETVKLDKTQAELDLDKFRAEQAAKPIDLKVQAIPTEGINTLKEFGNVASSADIAATAAKFQSDVAAAISAGNKGALAELIQAGRQFVTDAQAGFAKLAQLTGGSAIPGDISEALRKIALTISTAGGFAGSVTGPAGGAFKDDPVAQAIADAQRKQLEQQQQQTQAAHTGNSIATAQLQATRSLSTAIGSGSFATDMLKKTNDAQFLSGATR